MAILLDTNILLRWHETSSPDYLTINQLLDRFISQGEELCFAAQNVYECWNALTRPLRVNGFGHTPQEAEARIRLIEENLHFLPEDVNIYWLWRDLALRYEVSGVQVHDLRIVAAMLHYNVKQILTFNASDFKRYKEIEVIYPRG